MTHANNKTLGGINLQGTNYSLVTVEGIPHEIDLSHLKDKNRLLTADQVSLIKNADLKQGRTTKKELKQKTGQKIPYAIERVGDNYFAIYLGVKKRKHIYHSEENNTTVKFIQNIDTGKWEVLKLQKFNKDAQQVMKDYLNAEIEGLQYVDQYIKDNEHVDKSGMSQNELLMKRVPGKNLLKLIQSSINLPPAYWINAAIDILSEVEKLHDQNILHRDLKLENIMFNHGKIQPVDFAYARKVNGNRLELIEGPMGTAGYMAPEIAREYEKALARKDFSAVTYNANTEVYALGQILAELLGLTQSIYEKRDLITNPRNPEERQIVNYNEDDSPQYRDHPIPDVEARVAAHQLITEMFDDISHLRPSISKLKMDLEDIRDNKLSTSSRLILTAWLDVDEYLAADDFKRNEMKIALLSAHEVWLTGNKNDPDLVSKVLNIKYDLEKTGLPVQDEVLTHEKGKKLDAIAEFTQARNVQNKSLYYNTLYFSPANLNTDFIEYAHKKNIVPVKLASALDEPLDYDNEIQSGLAKIKPGSMDIIKAGIDIDLRKNQIDAQNNAKLQQAIDNYANNTIKTLYENKPGWQEFYTTLTRFDESINKLNALNERRTFLQNNINLAPVDNLTDAVKIRKLEISNNLDEIFNTIPESPDINSMQDFILDYETQLKNSAAGIDETYKSIQDEQLNIDLSETEQSNKRKELLTKHILIYHYELRDILEKLVLMQNYIKTHPDLSQSQLSDINFEISHGYQLIQKDILKHNSLKLALYKPIMDADEYHALNNSINSPQTLRILSMADTIRQKVSDSEYQNLLKLSRDAVDKNRYQNTDTSNAAMLIENSIRNLPESDDWRRDLFDYRVNRILAPGKNENISAEEQIAQLKQYSNLETGELKPEYAQYEKTGKKLRAARNLFINQGLISLASEQKKEAEPLVIASQKKYLFNTFHLEQAQLVKLTNKLNAALERYSGLQTLNKKQIRKLDKLETKLADQLRFVDENLDSYWQDPRHHSDFRHHALSMAVYKINKANEALDTLEARFPYEQRRKFGTQIYLDIKQELVSAINRFDALFTTSSDSEKQAANFSEITTYIINKIDDLRNEYAEMKAAKKGIKKKLKPSEITPLLKEEKEYIKNLEQMRSEYETLLKNHDAEIQLQTEALQLYEIVDDLYNNIEDLTLNQEQKDALTSRLTTIKDNLTWLNNSWYTPFYTLPPSEKQREDVRNQIQTLNDSFKQVMISGITAFKKLGIMQLNIMTNNRVRESRGDLDRYNKINTMHDELNSITAAADQSSQTLSSQFNRVQQAIANIHEIENEYKQTLINHSDNIITTKRDELDGILASGSPELADTVRNKIIELERLSHYPDNAGINKFITHYKTIEASLKDSDGLLAEIKAQDKVDEQQIRMNASSLHEDIASALSRPLDDELKFELTELSKTLFNLDLPGQENADKHIPWADLVKFNNNIIEIEQAFKSSLLSAINNLSRDNEARLTAIRDKNLRSSDEGKLQDHKMYAALDQLAYLESTKAVETDPVNYKTLIDSLMLFKNTNEKIAELNEEINSECEKTRITLQNLAANINRDYLPQLEKNINEHLYDEITDTFYMEKTPEQEDLERLESMKAQVHEIEERLKTENLPYNVLDLSNNQLNALLLEADTKTNFLAMQNVVKKESGNLHEFANSGSEFIATITKKFENVQTELDQIHDLPLAERKPRLDEIKPLIMANTIANLEFTLNEFSSADDFNPGFISAEHLLSFYDSATNTISRDYDTFLDKTHPAYSGLMDSFNKIKGKIQSQEMARNAKVFQQRPITDAFDVHETRLKTDFLSKNIITDAELADRYQMFVAETVKPITRPVRVLAAEQQRVKERMPLNTANQIMRDITSSAKDYFLDKTSSLEFANTLLSARELFKNHSRYYNQLIQLAENMQINDKTVTLDEFKNLGKFFPEALRLKDEDLVIEPAPAKTDKRKISRQKAQAQFNRYARKALVKPLQSQPATPVFEPPAFPDKILANHLHILNSFMVNYAGGGIRANSENIQRLQTLVGNLHKALHKDHPLYASIHTLNNNLKDINNLPNEFDANYLTAKIAARNLENFANQFSGTRPDFSPLTRKVNDLKARTTIEMHSADPKAKARLDVIMKECLELHARMNIIHSRLDKSAPDIFSDFLKTNAQELVGTIREIKAFEGPDKVMTYAKGESEIITFDPDATPEQNMARVRQILKTNIHSNADNASTLSMTANKLENNQFRIDPVETYHYTSRGLFSTKTGTVKIAIGIGRIGNKHVAVVLHEGDLSKLSRKQLLIISARLVKKFYAENVDNVMFMKDIPPELARTIVTYCKLAAKRYPTPDTTGINIPAYSGYKQMNYEKEMERYLRDPQVIKEITTISKDVVLSAKHAAKEREMLDRMRGIEPHFKNPFKKN